MYNKGTQLTTVM